MAEQKILEAEQVAGYGPAGCGVVAIANGQPGQSLGIGGDGKPAWLDCCVEVTQNLDGTITIQVQNDDPVVVHPPMTVTFHDGAGNSFDAAMQTLNIDFPTDVLLESSTFDNATGILTLTMSNGDVHQVDLSAFWPVHADQVSVMGDGTPGDPLRGYAVEPAPGPGPGGGVIEHIVTRQDGSTFVLPVCDDCHPAATLTNNAAAFAWDDATQSGNIPPVTKATLNPDGSLTITFGDGSGSVTLPAPVGGAGHPAATVTYTDTAFSWDGATQVLNVPRLNLVTSQDLTNGNRASLSADRTVLRIPDPIFARRQSTALNIFVPADVFVPMVGLTDVSVDTLPANTMTGSSNDVIEIPIDGWYTIHGSVGTDDLINENEVLMVTLTINGAYASRGNAQPGQIVGLDNAPIATLPWQFLSAGDLIGVGAHTNKAGGLFIDTAFVGVELKMGA